MSNVENWAPIVAWGLEHKDQLLAQLRQVKSWLFPPTDDQSNGTILIIGPGGVGKSTTGQFLSCSNKSPLKFDAAYQESINLERFPLEDDPKTELLILPGQRHRRDTTWNSLLQTIATGDCRGIIVTSCYGYHSLGQFSYKNHFLYKNNKNDFVDAFLQHNRIDELNVLRRLASHFDSRTCKCWLLTLVTKQDLWWQNRKQVTSYYQEGEYANVVRDMSENIGNNNFRHEFVFCSLAISNFITGAKEVLAKTSVGYDQQLQSQSLVSLVETLYALKEWEQN